MNINLQNYYNDANVLNGNRNVSGEAVVQNNVNIDNTGDISLKDLVTGDIFSGKIIDINSYNVDILLDNNEHVNATMQQALELNIGDKLLFQVKDKNDSQIIIRPVANNQVSMELVTKSLLAAGLTINDKNTAIVKELISNGQPIDRQSIMNMIKLTSSYGSENIDKLVDMTKNGIEINKNNLEQYDLYAESKHQITESLNNIQNEIISLITSNENGKNNLIGGNINDNINLIEDLSKALEDSVNGDLADKEVLENKTVSNVKSEENLKVIQSDAGAEKELQISNDKSLDKTNILNEFIESVSNNEQNANNKGKEIIKLFESFNDMAEALKYISDKSNGEEAIKKLLKNPELKTKMQKLFSDKLLLVPKEMEENKEKIKEDIDKIYSRLEKLTDVIKENAVTSRNETLTSFADKLKGNLNFMNDLNQIESYVQLPIKFSESNKNGDLYVYNRKNKKLSDKDVLTAFLHLDMEYLGATDVNISMEKKSVTTKFTLDNAESQKLVANHIDELIMKLEKLGYNVKITTELEEKGIESASNALIPITENNDNAVSIKRYTLDIRT